MRQPDTVVPTCVQVSGLYLVFFFTTTFSNMLYALYLLIIQRLKFLFDILWMTASDGKIYSLGADGSCSLIKSKLDLCLNVGKFTSKNHSVCYIHDITCESWVGRSIPEKG